MIDFLTEALKYTAIGWQVFPCAEGGKVPAIKGGHGVKDATLAQPQLREWALEYPGSNIGLACGEPSGGIVVVDVDPRSGGDSSLAGLALKGRAFPHGPHSKTGNGGQHLFFRYDGKLSNSKGRMGAGIDIRATGGYVVAPPSWLKPSDSGNGGRYEWIVSPFEAPVPRLPIWMSELLKPREAKPYVPPKTFAEGAERIAHLADFASRAPSGQRNMSTFWAACRAAEVVLDGKANKHAVMERLRSAGQMSGLSPDEVERAIQNAMDRIIGKDAT